MKISTVIVTMALLSTASFAQEKTTADVPKDAETKKIIEKIAGSWKLQQIVDEEQGNKATENDPNKKANKANTGSGGSAESNDQSNNAMQMIDFNPNGRYKLNNSTTAVDSGSYRINEQHGFLYLESDSDDITPTEWAITHQDQQLTLVGRGEASESRYKYVYVKVKEKVSTN